MASDGLSLATFLPDGLNFLLYSTATNLVPGMVDGNGAGADLYAGNRTSGGLQLISSSGSSATTSGNQGLWINLAFSANGRFVAYGTPASNAIAGGSDGNGAPDVILHDRQLGTAFWSPTLPGRWARPPTRDRPRSPCRRTASCCFSRASPPT